MNKKNQNVLTIDLVRHGLSISNSLGKYSNSLKDPLAPEAYPELEVLYNQVKHTHYTHAYSSPYQRCQETAQFILQDKSIDISIQEPIREMDLGPWDGLTPEEIQAQYPEEWKTWNEKPDDLDLENRETVTQVSNRVIRWLLALVDDNYAADSHILIATHVIVIRVIIAHYGHIALSKIRQIHVPNVNCYRLQYFEQEPVIWELVSSANFDNLAGIKDRDDLWNSNVR